MGWEGNHESIGLGLGHARRKPCTHQGFRLNGYIHTRAHDLCRVQRVVRRIMGHAPFTTILASATMPPSWDFLPRWWKGRSSAMRTAISLVRCAWA